MNQDSFTHVTSVLSPRRLGAGALALLLLSGCSVLQEDKVDYKGAKRVSNLSVPPDLSQLSSESRFQVPGGDAVTASEMGRTATAAPVTAVASVADVRIERSGDQRWLVVQRPPEAIWPSMRAFWEDNGFVLERDQSELGIMETGWAENRAKLPQDFIRNTIGRLFDNLYSTGERDRFRTRLERSVDGKSTEIYVTHRGMVEVYSDRNKDQTIWQPRPSDAELETEFLRRMMLQLGVSEADAGAAVGSSAAVASVRPSLRNGNVLTLEHGFDRAWRRVGLSLDRSGFSVEDRDRSKGLYWVRVLDSAQGEKPGLLSRLFKAEPTNTNNAQRLQVVVRSEDQRSFVTVQNDQGQADSSPAALRVVQLLADQLQ